jgi:integrase
MKLMALTFVRTSELISAHWDEFDVEARRWNIPAQRMKMKTPHIVPLATQAIEVIELLRSVTGGGELLFPGDVVVTKLYRWHNHEILSNGVGGVARSR